MRESVFLRSNDTLFHRLQIDKTLNKGNLIFSYYSLYRFYMETRFSYGLLFHFFICL